jgi:hypothetical protein
LSAIGLASIPFKSSKPSPTAALIEGIGLPPLWPKSGDTIETPAFNIDAGKLAEKARFDGVQGDATAGRTGARYAHSAEARPIQWTIAMPAQLRDNLKVGLLCCPSSSLPPPRHWVPSIHTL